MSKDPLREADNYLDADAQVIEFAKLGSKLYEVFGDDKDRVSTQVRNLQQLVVSARRLGDVEDFVKNQMGKKTAASEDWRKVGDALLGHLKMLREQADHLAADEAERLRLRLHLARGWVRTVVGAYLFAKAKKGLPV